MASLASEVYEVVLTGGAPWGFRLQGGKEFRAPLRIAKVTPGSKAENAGINEGDLVRSINDSNCEDWTHSDALNSIKKCGFELMMLLCRKPPSSPQPTRATPSTLPRPTAVQSSYDDLALPGKVVSRAVFKASSSDQQVPSYATLPRTTRVETENRKQNYDNINEDPGFESYDGARSNEWNPDIISDVVKPPKQIELVRSEDAIRSVATTNQTESAPPSTHFKAPGDVRGFTDKPHPIGRGGRRFQDETAHGVNPQLTSSSIGSEEDFDTRMANGDLSSTDSGVVDSGRPPALVHLRKQKEVAAVQAVQEPLPVKTAVAPPMRQERYSAPSEQDHGYDHGPSRVKIKKGGKWYKEMFKEMHSTAGASSNLSALLASDAHKGAPRDESSSPTFDDTDNDVFTRPSASSAGYHNEEPIRSTYTTTVSSQRAPSWDSDSSSEKKPSWSAVPLRQGERRISAGRKVPSWYKELQRGDEVPLDKIEHPESYVVSSHRKQPSFDSTEELRQYSPREHAHVSQPNIRTYTPPPSHALDIRRPAPSSHVNHIGREARPQPVTVQQEERMQPPSASSLYESRFRRTSQPVTIKLTPTPPVTIKLTPTPPVPPPLSPPPLPSPLVTVVRAKLGNIDRSQTAAEKLQVRQQPPSDEDVLRRQREEEAQRREEEARRREEEARRRREEEEERRRAEEEELRRQQEEERRRRQREEEMRRRQALEEETRRKAAQKPQFIAKALYSFQAQNPRELSFKKGDIMIVKRQIDKNWIEGENSGLTGIFPTNYVELRPYEDEEEEEQIVAPVQVTQVHAAPPPASAPAPTPVSTPAPTQSPVPTPAPTRVQGPVEGEARARYTFKAEGQRELPCSKGDILTLVRRIDKNWYEARLRGHAGIIPASYIEVYREPGAPQKGIPQQQQSRATGAPQEQVQEYIAPTYQPQEQQLPRQEPQRRQEPQKQESPRHEAPRQEQIIDTRKPPISTTYQENNNIYKPDFVDRSSPTRVTQVKYIEELPDMSDLVHAQPVAEYDDGRTVFPMQGERYKAVFSYDPMNEDELFLEEGDEVIVLEKCDDGWYVGTSTKTGLFGTFPGNYVVALCKYISTLKLLQFFSIDCFCVRRVKECNCVKF